MARNSGLHESFDNGEEIKSGSDRSFGLVFAVFFVVVGLFPLIGGAGLRYWAVAVSAVFALSAVLMPSVLAPLNRIWFKFGLLLHKVVNPIIMGVMFFGIIMPTGLIMRLLSKDLLRLRFDKSAPTYWIERSPPEQESMRNQF